MDHVNIARVFDGGATDSGRPYFVMELVKGVPITDFCDRNRLTPRQRLELFVSVCHAVQHAHQKGIIHRDLKPSNVLVSLHDATPVVKVIDFGVAKALGQELTDKSLFTGFAQMIGTPLYMSPEQAGRSGLDIDTRSDIYSLGVLLYELLTGTTPFDQDRFKQAAYDEIRRIIREDEPPRPSTRLSDSKDVLPSIAANRSLDPKKLTGLVRGDLDWIVMKALEKDRNRRYETASGFALDIQRYLADEPVLASPPSAIYRLRKFARRNKVTLTFASLILLFIVLLGSGVGWMVRDRGAREEEFARRREAREQEVARDRAARTAETCRAVARALDEGRDWLDRERLPEAIAAVEQAEALAGHAEADAATVAHVRQARRNVDVVAEIDDLRFGSSTISAYELNFDGQHLYEQFFTRLGIDVDGATVEAAAAQIAGDPLRKQLVTVLENWARVRLNVKLVEKERSDGWWHRLLLIANAADPDDVRTLVRTAIIQGDFETLDRLAGASEVEQMPTSTVRQLARALLWTDSLQRKELAIRILKQAQIRHPDNFGINVDLGQYLPYLPKPRDEEALSYMRVAHAIRPKHALVRGTIGNLLLKLGRPEEAIAEYSHALAQNLDSALDWYNRGVAHAELKDWEKARDDYSRAIALRPDWVSPWINRATCFDKLRQSHEALADLSKAIKLNPDDSSAWNNRGACFAHLQQWDKALTDFSKAIELNPRYESAWSNRGMTYASLKEWDKALADCSKSIELKEDFAGAWFNRGCARIGLNQWEEAAADFSRAIELKYPDPIVWSNRGACYRQLKQWDRALADNSKAIELSPDGMLGWYNRALSYSDLKEWDKALSDLSRAIELAPDHADAWGARGNANKNLNQLEKALADYSRAVDLRPDHAGTLYNRGHTYRALQQPVNAIADYSKAIELQPDYAPAWNNRGNCHRDLQQWDRALIDHTKVVELKLDDVTMWFNRGLTYQALQQPDKGIADYSRAIELQPDYAPAWNNRGNCYRGLKQCDKAVADYSKAIELEPDDTVAWLNRGQTFDYFLNQWDRALSDYEKLLELNPKSADLHNNLAWTLAASPDLKRRDPPKAVELALKAVALAPQGG